MNLKKMFQAISNPNLSIQERLFRLIVTIGMAGLALAIVVGILSQEKLSNTVPLIIFLAIIMGITFFTIRSGKIQFGAVLISIFIIYFILPFNFLTSGGIYGGGPIWFLFGVVFVCLVVEKKIKYVFVISGFVLQSVCYYIAYFYPQCIIPHTISLAYIDSYVTLMIVTILIICMILFQNLIYRKENAIAREQKKEIEELNKMQNRFFSSMSHEIRTPINTIIGLNEMILREDVSDEVASDARNIQGASKMLLALINDILDMSKIESGKMDIVPVEYNVGDMLSDVVNMIWVRAKEKGLEFHIDVDSAIPAQLLGDEVRIKQILINLLNNAIKYTSEGTVTLSIQCKMQDNGFAYISYSVTDTGIGIKKENIPHLFSAFRRVDEANNRYIEGTGLGLSIVKQLVNLMDGEVTVNSVYTKGSTFMVTIPQAIVNDSEIGDIDIANFDFTKKYKKNSKTGQLLTRSIQVVRAIRSVGRYAKSEADILNSMYRIIRDNLGVDISTAFVGKPVVRFAQKICQDFTRNGGSRPRFTRSAKERVQHLIRPGKVDSSELIQNLTVMIVIDADGKELMEIPICCDTNPVTLAYTEGFGKVTLPSGKTVDITSWVTDARKRILSNASIAQKDKYMALVNELIPALTT